MNPTAKRLAIWAAAGLAVTGLAVPVSAALIGPRAEIAPTPTQPSVTSAVTVATTPDSTSTTSVTTVTTPTATVPRIRSAPDASNGHRADDPDADDPDADHPLADDDGDRRDRTVEQHRRRR